MKKHSFSCPVPRQESLRTGCTAIREEVKSSHDFQFNDATLERWHFMPTPRLFYIFYFYDQSTCR